MRQLRLDEDHHVHSTFSDGSGTVLEMARQAAARGLTTLGFADHVRRDSDWLDSYVDAVRLARLEVPDVDLRIGVEAKILDQSGTLDVPDRLDGIDQIVIADHQFPGIYGTMHPSVIKAAVADGSLSPLEVVRAMVESTRQAVLACPRDAIVGHLFSILPKVGIEHGSFSSSLVDPLLEACLLRNARIEVDERWRSPGIEVVERALRAGVRVVASTDSHNLRAVGRYRYVQHLHKHFA
jgi:putative hydrolase